MDNSIALMHCIDNIDKEQSELGDSQCNRAVLIEFKINTHLPYVSVNEKWLNYPQNTINKLPSMIKI